MFATAIIAAIAALLFASLGILIALKIQYRYLQRTHIQHRAWEQAQEGYLHNWETKQEKRFQGAESRLTARVQQVERAWQAWEKKDAERIETLEQQYTRISASLHIERELARLPLIEETPLVFNSNGQRVTELSSWQPPALARANLSGRDLSHRYLGQADLREAQLRGTSFFMSDLSGACLAGANLTEADLTGANLSYADLRNSVLSDANLQVADLRHAVLLGANLHNARHLTTQQIYSAIYDHTTRLDSDVDLTMPRLPRISRSMLNQTARSQAPEVAPPTSEPAIHEVESNQQTELAQPESEMPVAESATLATMETSDVAVPTEGEMATEENGNEVVAAADEMASLLAAEPEIPIAETETEATFEAETPPETSGEDAASPQLVPLVFPRTIEDAEEDDTFVMPALNGHHSEETTLPAADEPQSQEQTSEPEPSSSPEPSEDTEYQHPAPIRGVRKSKRSALNAPIDITMQKGKYQGTSKRRARAR